MCEHLWRNEGKSNNHLQSAIALYGLENFEYFVIEFVTDKGLLIKVEQKYLDIVPSNLRYNFCPQKCSHHPFRVMPAFLWVGEPTEMLAAHASHAKHALQAFLTAGSRLGTNHSAETKAAISEAHKGKVLSAETKAAISAARLGTTHSPESKAAIGAANGSINFVYDINEELLGEFPSQRAAARYIQCDKRTVSRYIDSGKRFRDFLITSKPLKK